MTNRNALGTQKELLATQNHTLEKQLADLSVWQVTPTGFGIKSQVNTLGSTKEAFNTDVSLLHQESLDRKG